MSLISYKNQIALCNEKIAGEKTKFIGYGLMKGRALGSLNNVADTCIIETPVAENLMIGLGIGLSLKGYLAVVFIERMDFILNALDAIVNHLDKIALISEREFNPAIIIRCIVGNKNKPLYTGLTHTQDFSEALRLMVSFPVRQLLTVNDVQKYYDEAIENYHKGISTILVEYKDNL